MKCNECQFCRAKRGRVAPNSYECKRPVYSKFYNRPVYAYMDVNASDECHYGGIENEKSKDTASRAAAS